MHALTHALALVDLQHPKASKAVTAILKPLEQLTRSQPPAVMPPAKVCVLRPSCLCVLHCAWVHVLCLCLEAACPAGSLESVPSWCVG